MNQQEQIDDKDNIRVLMSRNEGSLLSLSSLSNNRRRGTKNNGNIANADDKGYEEDEEGEAYGEDYDDDDLELVPSTSKSEKGINNRNSSSSKQQLLPSASNSGGDQQFPLEILTRKNTNTFKALNDESMSILTWKSSNKGQAPVAILDSNVFVPPSTEKGSVVNSGGSNLYKVPSQNSLLPDDDDPKTISSSNNNHFNSNHNILNHSQNNESIDDEGSIYSNTNGAVTADSEVDTSARLNGKSSGFGGGSGNPFFRLLVRFGKALDKMINLFAAEGDYNRRDLLVYFLIFGVILNGPCLAFDNLVRGEDGQPYQLGGRSIFYWSILLTILIGGFLLSEVILASLLYLIMKIPLVATLNGSILYYLRESGKIFSYALWLSILLLVETACSDPANEENNVFPLQVQGLFRRGFIAFLVLSAAFLIKRQVITQMAINFNARNYVERIKEALCFDEVVKALGRSKSTYKLRKKASLFLTSFGGSHSVPAGGGGQYGANDNFGGGATSHHRFPRMAMLFNSSNNHLNNNNNSNNNSSSSNLTAPNNFNGIKKTRRIHHPLNSVSSPVNATPIVGQGRMRISKDSENSNLKKATFSSSNNSNGQGNGTSASHLLHQFFLLVSRDKHIYDPSKGDCRHEIHQVARIQARRLFKWLRDGHDYVSPKDLSIYLNDDEEMIQALYSLFSLPNISQNHTNSDQPLDSSANTSPVATDNSGTMPILQLSEADFESMFFRMYRERHRLARNLKSMRSAVQKVDTMMTSIIMVLFLLSSLLFFFDIALEKVQTIFTILVVGLTFMFGNTVKTAFESIIFLFYIHPYDIGDRVFIPAQSSDSNNQFHDVIITDVQLLTTVCERVKDGIRMYMPNSVLFTKTILNLRRSGCLGEEILLSIDFETSTERIQKLKSLFLNFIRERPEEFTDSYSFELGGLEARQIVCKLKFQHRSNYQDRPLVNRRRNLVWCFLIQSLKELEIKYYRDSPVVLVHSNAPPSPVLSQL